VRRHFERLGANLRVCLFDYGPIFFAPAETGGTTGPAGEAMLTWTMRLNLRRGPAETLVVPGVSHLRFGDRIDYQRDHFDAGALIYENVPVLGALVRFVKRRL
jgi:hypothetical protein